MGSAIMWRSGSNKIGSDQESSTREVKEYLHVAGTPGHEAAKLARHFAGDGIHTGVGFGGRLGVGSRAGDGHLGVLSCSGVGSRDIPMLIYIAVPNR